MLKREAYKLVYVDRFYTMEPKVEGLKTFTARLSPFQRLGLKPQIDTVRIRLDALSRRLMHVTVATEDVWDEARADAEAAWSDFQAAIDDAYHRIQALPSERTESHTRR